MARLNFLSSKITATPPGHDEESISHLHGVGHDHDSTGYQNGVGHHIFHNEHIGDDHNVGADPAVSDIPNEGEFEIADLFTLPPLSEDMPAVSDEDLAEEDGELELLF
ncbi:hypothetical protein EU803_02395 [Loktanella sp. IMCC34160]|uniref:hypothetical protein n=1 Tax=Loktanella sp. IMCC34160 TaxID=2510646 RepID=UPI00101DA96F|nr:hypothetical protein [Loktanella sp. IMCC34160]RYG92976.1 hypothetical protein EU803_02395 [Loktanella sp. IMCC34160]